MLDLLPCLLSTIPDRNDLFVPSSVSRRTAISALWNIVMFCAEGAIRSILGHREF